MPHPWTIETCSDDHMCGTCEYEDNPVSSLICSECIDKYTCNWEPKGVDPNIDICAGVLCVDHSDD